MGPTESPEPEKPYQPSGPHFFPATGPHAGRYLVLRALGRGARGAVWLVRDRATAHLWALKESRDVEALRMEWNCLVDLEGHPRMPLPDRFYESPQDATSSDAPHAFFTMEWVEGNPLHEATGLRAGTVEKLFVDACSGLEFLHRRGWIHGDLKPENLLVVREPGGDLSLRLIDFSLSRLEGQEVPGWVRGTPHFAAPSILRGLPADRSSDLYSLGRSFQEGCSPESLNEGSELAQLLLRLTEAEPGSRLSTVHAVLAEGSFLGKDVQERVRLEAAEAEPRYRDFGGHLARACDQAVRAHQAPHRSQAPQLSVRIPEGTGARRWMRELRRSLLNEGVEALEMCEGWGASDGVEICLTLAEDEADEGQRAEFAIPARCEPEAATVPLLLVAERGPTCATEGDRPRSDDLKAVVLDLLGKGPEELQIAPLLAQGTRGSIPWAASAARLWLRRGREDQFPLELRELFERALPSLYREGLERKYSAPEVDWCAVGKLSLSGAPFSQEEGRRVTGDPSTLEELIRAGLLEEALEEANEVARAEGLVVARDASFLASRLEETERREAHALWLSLRQQEKDSSVDEFEQAVRVGERAAILKAGGRLMRYALRHRRSREAVHALDVMRQAIPNGIEGSLSATELAEHLELAGDALLAARSAREAFAFFERADRLPSSHAEREARLLRKRAMARDALGDHQGALELQTRALSLEERISWQERVQIFERLGEYTAKLGNNEAAENWLERGLATPSAEADSPEMASIWNNLGVVYSLRGDEEASRERHERALRVRERIGDEEGISRSLTNLSWTDLEFGELDIAKERTTRALEIKRRLGQLESATSDLSLLTEIHKRRGEFAQAIARATEMAQIRQSLGAAEAEVASQLTLAHLWLELGRYPEALRHSDLGLELLRRTGLKRNHLHASHFLRGRLELSLGRVQAVERAAQELLELTEGDGKEGYTFAARTLLFALEDSDSNSPVERRLGEARHDELLNEGVTVLGPSLDSIEALLLLSATLRQRGDFERALAAARECSQRASFSKSEPHRLKALHAEAAAGLGLAWTPSKVSKQLHETLEGAEAIGLQELTWKVSAELYRLHERGGRADRAYFWLGRCAEIFSVTLEAWKDVEMAESYLQVRERAELLQALEDRHSLE